MATKDITLQTSDGPMRVYEATPDGPAQGAVIVIQEAFGVNGHIEDVTRRVAAAGYHALSPELFHRSGERAVVPYDDVQQAIGHIQKVTNDAILLDVDACIKHLHEQGFTNHQIGIVGFCMDHWGIQVDTEAELDEILRRAKAYQEKDPRVHIVDKHADEYTQLTLTSIYIGYLLPMTLEVQWWAFK